MSTTPNPLVDRYLARFRDGLKGARAEEREEFVGEIESHIAEAVAAGDQVGAVLYRLGPADRLAKAYRAELTLKSRSGNLLWRLFAVLGLLVTASIPSMVIIPLLLLLGLAGIAGGVAAIVYASVPALQADFYTITNDNLNRTFGALTGAGLIVGGLTCLAVLYLYVLLLIRAMRTALKVGS
jgi:uncharacterized membrane protein